LQTAPAGASWDRAYALVQVEQHNATLTLLRAEARDGQDPALKAFAQAQIPIVREHLNMALTNLGF
ncbi:MAG TPA: DUF4142 domain-containing protein, partial [Deinococcales bacterium]|nr:DUF4142 domain-containing protein [Deinococcales bacterium]